MPRGAAEKMLAGTVVNMIVHAFLTSSRGAEVVHAINWAVKKQVIIADINRQLEKRPQVIEGTTRDFFAPWRIIAWQREAGLR